MAQMNVKRFRGLMGDLVKASVQNASPYASKIIECATTRISELNGLKDEDCLRVEDEIIRIIDSLTGTKEGELLKGES